MTSKSTIERPVLPKGVVYRHSLGVLIVLTLMIEFLFGAITMSNYLNHSSWMFLWGAVFITLPFMVIWRLFWLEKHGWWKRRVVHIPDLPVEFRGLDWKATFETAQVIGQGGQLPGSARAIGYAQIKRVELGTAGGLNILASGQVPITLGKGADHFLLVTLLAHLAPQAEFRGATLPMRDGWEPRF